MKGIVFTEFLEMVEDQIGPEVADQIVTECKLPSGGAYTSLGTYDHQEIVQLVGRLSEVTGTPVPALLRAFGQHLFGRFAIAYPGFFEGISSAFDFLANIESYIHVEVRKLYPEAELPSFEHEMTNGRMLLTYRSSRPFGDLATGLIQGCIAHFGEAIDLSEEDLSGGRRACVRFELVRR